MKVCELGIRDEELGIMLIHLLRHGKTEANEKGLFCGSTDVPLAPAGIGELQELIKQSIYPSAELLFTSGMLRAKESAYLIYGDMPINQITDLNEYDFGYFEMKSYEEIKDRADFQEWVDDLSGVTKCPGGESQKDYQERVIRAFSTIIDEIDKAACSSASIICHGGVIVRIMQWLFPEMHDYPDLQPENGRGYSIDYGTNKPHTYSRI